MIVFAQCWPHTPMRSTACRILHKADVTDRRVWELTPDPLLMGSSDFRSTSSEGKSKGRYFFVSSAQIYHWRELPQVPFLSQQNYICRSWRKKKLDVFCRDKHVFVATKMILVIAPANDRSTSSDRNGQNVYNALFVYSQSSFALYDFHTDVE